MTQLLIAPILLPLCAATLLVLLARAPIATQRALALVTTLACLGTSLALAHAATLDTGILHYAVGNWPMPFGIALVNDRLSSTMLLLTDVVALAALAHACRGSDADARHFHALFQFQLAGVHGAFLTGDLFNLFVFFEILLIASYCLLLHGGGVARLRAALHYVLLNLVGSTLFLVAIGTLYGVTGALNMAHIALRIRELGEGDAVLARAAGLLALVVFGLKAGLAPLYFWLPRAYPAAPAAVAALFAIMTKVGVYCIVRVSTLMFGADAGAGADLAPTVLLPVALITQMLAVLGALSSRDLRGLTSYLLINSIGVMVAGVALAREAALSAALYYLVQSTITAAALFLLAEHVARARGDVRDSFLTGPLHADAGYLGSGFVVATLAVVGLPPLAGFLGKAGILLASSPTTPAGLSLWVVLLAGSFVALLACVRAGSAVFWDTSAALAAPARVPRSTGLPWLFLLAAALALAAFAGPAMELADSTAQQLLDPASYLEAVLPPELML